MHVVLGVDPNPDPATKNELIFTYQEDHIFWVESFLALNPILTLGLGPFFLKHLRPLAGWLHSSSCADMAAHDPPCDTPHCYIHMADHSSKNLVQCWP